MRQAALLATALFAACGGSSGDGPAPPESAVPGPSVLKQYTGAEACERAGADLRGRIEHGLRERLQWQRYAFALASSGGSAVPQAPAPSSAAPEAGGAPASSAASWSDTNVRTAGVDEADLVKTDGRSLYHLKSTGTGVTLSRVDLAGDGAMTLAGQWRSASGVPVAGMSGRELGDGLYLLAAADGAPADPSGGASGTGGGATDRIALVTTIGSGAMIRPTAAPTMPMLPVIDLAPAPVCTAGGCAAAGAPEVRIRLVDPASSPFTVEREIRLDGWLVGSRRIGGRLVVVTQAQMPVPAGLVTSADGTAAGEARALETNRLALAALSLPQLLAPQAAGSAGALPADGAGPDPAACATLLAPDTPAWPGRVQIASIDLAAGQVDRQTVLGNASGVYLSNRSLVLTTPTSNWFRSTDLHRFTIDDRGRLAYHGSGRIDGRLLDDHAIDESAAGPIRVALQQWEASASPGFGGRPQTRLAVLDPSAAPVPWPVLGQTPPIAPGETLTGARFIGDRAYLVTALIPTFDDPLVVVDLADPGRPTVQGELKLPGITRYLHPVGPDHLIGIGEARDGTGATTVKATLFDVSAPAAPREQAALALGNAWTGSEALWDRHAFAWYSPPTSAATVAAGLPSGGSAGTLAIPIRSEASPWSAAPDLSALQVVSVRPEAGPVALSLNGTLTMTDRLDGRRGPDGWRDGDVRRGVFVDAMVYAISDGALRSAPIRDPSTPVATLALP